mgnify:CR=1 FL=1
MHKPSRKPILKLLFSAEFVILILSELIGIKLFVFSVYGSHYLGCVLCSPLGKEVVHLKILYTHSAAHFEPSAQFFKSKSVFAIINSNVYQLSGETLASHKGIQRWSKQGSQKRIDTGLNCFLCIK